MRKITITTSFFIVVTLFMTQLATAQWKHNVVTNDSSNTLLVTFSTYQPKQGQIPEGWRTMGWYSINPGSSRSFPGWADNSIYFLLFHGGNFLEPDNPDIRKVNSWMSRKPYIVVLNGETGTDLGIQYTYVNKTELVENANFFQSDNGTDITVTSDRKVVVGPSLRSLDEPQLTISAGTGGTTVNQGSTRELTVSVTENGRPLTDRQLFLTLSQETGTFSPNTGRTDNNGQFKTTLTVNKDSSPGTFDVTAQIVGTNYSGTLSFTIEIGPGGISISASPSTIEPGQRSTLTFTVRTPGGDLFLGAQLSLSTSVGNINPTLVTTDSKGQAKATYTANPYTSTPHPRTISTPRITATVVDNPDVKKDTTLTVRYVPSSLSVSGVPSSITSGNTKSITATVKSKSGKPISGVPVSFSESSSYLRFSNSRVNTNNSGQAKSTLRTGGQTSGAKINVSTSGVSARSYTVRVNPEIRSTTRSFSQKGNVPPIWQTKKIRHWSEELTFPGRVVSAKRSCRVFNATVTRVRIRYPSENKVKVYYDIADGTWFDRATINCTITGEYEVVASTPGAPSLQPQLRPEADTLSSTWQELSQVPSETALLSNYPNPFNPETWIPYHLAEPAEVTLSIYSADGRLVRTLVLGHQSAGIYESKSRAAYWDGRNTVGERVASGVYFYMLTAGDFAATGKMLIMK